MSVLSRSSIRRLGTVWVAGAVVLAAACAGHLSVGSKGAGAILAQVRSGNDGAVVREAVLELQPVGADDWTHPLRAASTGSNGVAAISGLAPGRYQVRAHSGSTRSAVREIEVTGAGIYRVSLRLDATAAPSRQPEPNSFAALEA